MKVRYGPDGVHLFDRYTGLNVLVDECSVPEEQWSLAPRQVSIALTNICDLSCAHCYAPKSRDRLDACRVQSWLTELDGLGCFGVGFGGGEPTLHPDFVSLCRFGASETRLAVTFTTHAHHLTSDLARQLQGHVHFIRISMDGVWKTYEALRGRSFGALLEHLDTACTLCAVGVNFVVNSDTLPDLPEAVEIAERYGVRELLLLPEQKTYQRPGVTRETLEALKTWVEGYRGPIPLAMSEADASGFPACRPLVKEAPLDAFVHINAFGELLTSSYRKNGVALGNSTFLAAYQALRKREQMGSL